MAKMLFWKIEIGVDESWVADGFDLTKERAMDMLRNDLQYAHEHELMVRILERPDRMAIRRAQGYKTKHGKT